MIESQKPPLPTQQIKMQIHISQVELSTTNQLACKVLYDLYHSPGDVDDISSALVLLRGKTLYILKDKEFEMRDNL